MKKKSTIKFILKYSFLGLILGGLILFFMPNSQLSFNWQNAQKAWQFYLSQSQKKESKPFSIADISFSDAVKKASPSVVSINVYRPKGIRESDLLGPDKKIIDISVGIGSGVILSNDGYIVTSYHVIAGTQETISINFYNGKRRIAKVVDYDQQMDIAILKTELQGLTSATLANSENVNVGDIVMAIGSPFALDMSVSLGIVSAWTMTNKGYKLIQTDASINTGNSGGALINNLGEVIGINRSIYTKNGAQTGINHAIPIERVKIIFNDILQFGYIRRNWLGIVVGELDERGHAKIYPNIPFGTGFIVAQVGQGSPAEKAGIQRKDFINGLDGETITGIASFNQLFMKKDIGSTINISLIRDGKQITKAIELVEVPRKNQPAEIQ